MAVLSLVLLLIALTAVLAGWLTEGRRQLQIGAVTLGGLLLAGVAGIGLISTGAATDSSLVTTLLLATAALLATAGGGPLTTVVFGLVDGRTPDARSMEQAGSVLRGGAWIGALERIAVFGTLVAGWPEGLAVVLGLKGLGRYPELRSGNNSGTAERFIIGTFASVLWATACAGVALLLV